MTASEPPCVRPGSPSETQYESDTDHPTMTKKIHPHCLSLIVLCLLAGCSLIPESKKIDYKSATKAPTLEVPPDLTSPSRDDRYAIPTMQQQRGSATLSDYTAERASAPRVQSDTVLPEIDPEKMRIVRDGNQRWLEINATPEQVWPVIKEFWQELGFIIDKENPESGVMETDWAEDRAKLDQGIIRNVLGKYLDALYSTSERDKFRTRIEPGQAPGTVDIFISHRGLAEVYVTEGKDQTRWQPREPDPDLEAEMLRRLMVRFGDDEKRAATAIAAADKAPQMRAHLVEQNGQPALLIDEKFDRAWRRVGLALDRVGFTVEDRDRANGLYFVRYVDPDVDAQTEGGWFSKLAFWRSSNKAEAKVEYRILVKEQQSEGKSAVQVVTREGGIDNSATGRKILSLLNDQLK